MWNDYQKEVVKELREISGILRELNNTLKVLPSQIPKDSPSPEISLKLANLEAWMNKLNTLYLSTERGKEKLTKAGKFALKLAQVRGEK